MCVGIGQDDAAAASHTVAAVMGDLPLSSATAGTDRATSARPQSTTDADTAASKCVVQSKAGSQAVKPKSLPAVTIKARAPQVMVKAKRKADDAQTDQPPDKKQTVDESLETSSFFKRPGACWACSLRKRQRQQRRQCSLIGWPHSDVESTVQMSVHFWPPALVSDIANVCSLCVVTTLDLPSVSHWCHAPLRCHRI